MLCRRVRERVRLGDTFIDPWTRGIPRAIEPLPPAAQPAGPDEPQSRERPRHRPLGPDNLSLTEAGAILGKARSTLHAWYLKGKFPPAVDIGPHLRARKPVV